MPCLKAFVLAILPYLEEDGNEFFDRTAALIQKLAKATSSEALYSALWMAISTSTHSRIPACNFLLKKMPKIKSKEDMVAICGLHSNHLLVQALCALAQDSNALVKRGALELLMSQFDFANRY